MNLASAYLLAAPDRGGDIGVNINPLIDIGVRYVVPIIVLLVGLSIIANFNRPDPSRAAMKIAMVLVGCAVIAGGMVWYTIADRIVSNITS